MIKDIIFIILLLLSVNADLFDRFKYNESLNQNKETTSQSTNKPLAFDNDLQLNKVFHSLRSIYEDYEGQRGKPVYHENNEDKLEWNYLKQLTNSNMIEKTLLYEKTKSEQHQDAYQLKEDPLEKLRKQLAEANKLINKIKKEDELAA